MYYIVMEQLTRISKSGKTMATTLSEFGKVVYKTMAELHSEANALNALFDEKQAQAKANADRINEIAKMNKVLAENSQVSSEVASFLQNGGNIIKDRKSWQAKAVENAVASKTEFKIYRKARKLYDGVASWTLDKEFAYAPSAYAADPGIQTVFEKIVHIGDMVTFVGNQNGYEQFEVIA